MWTISNVEIDQNWKIRENGMYVRTEQWFTNGTGTKKPHLELSLRELKILRATRSELYAFLAHGLKPIK